MYNLLLVALGGAIGASGRHILSGLSLRLFGPGFPVGTLSANIIGSALMGLLVGWLAFKGAGNGQSLRLFFGVGVLGGFTTFSAFSLESFSMLEKKAYGPLFAYVSASLFVSLAALALGLWLSRLIFSS
ncbi:camphor resistance protein CrcB [Litorimonas taeanensis]|uniref:Fluoride-specific ion channel FluC n=1 Tax=Litorimonas taeanensis TaxID=568099 RepID=A0A420WMG5_9PROT|nr:fluoride efflux transporter CrcB [Litorimonas taeanensis]RKQ72203.1 camphor resistance protein CrcB [Litorimonas taeanensis]